MRKTISEAGRSMIEILAVISIVAVITLGGIVAYRYATDKQRANLIIDEIEKRVAIALEAQSKGKDMDTWLDGFTLKIADSWDVEMTRLTDAFLSLEETPSISVLGVSYGVCKILKATQYPTNVTVLINDELPYFAKCKEDPATNKLTYALSPLAVFTCTSDAACPACMSCNTGAAICRDTECPTSGTKCNPNSPSTRSCDKVCTSKAQCAADEICQNGFCVPCILPKVPNRTGDACECPDKCLGDGFSGYDEKCQCICKKDAAVSTPDACTCPNGEILQKDKDGNYKCQKSSYCKPNTGDAGLFACYLAGDTNPCGNYCKDTTLADTKCYGTCNENWCKETLGEKGKDGKPVEWAFVSNGYGYSCRMDGSNCSPVRASSWQCFVDGHVCCRTASTTTAASYGYDKCLCGTCDESVCTTLKNALVSYENAEGVKVNTGVDVSYQAMNNYPAGCKVTINNKTSYCIPYAVRSCTTNETTGEKVCNDSSWTWYCTWNPPNSCPPGAKQRCLESGASFVELKKGVGGAFKNCWDPNPTISCPVANTTVLAGSGTSAYKATISGTPNGLACDYNNYHGYKVRCQPDRLCYIVTTKNGEETLQKCCYSAVLSPEYCTGGRCSKTTPEYYAAKHADVIAGKLSGDCPSGTELVSNGTYMGCKNMIKKNGVETGEYLFYLDGTTSADWACRYYNGKTGKQKISNANCGLRCRSDCSTCEQVFRDECKVALTDTCTDDDPSTCPLCTIADGTGEAIHKNGKRICQCPPTINSETNESNYIESMDHCCPRGFEYLGGQCQKTTCEPYQCFSGIECKDITSELKRKSATDSSCVCKSVASCYNELQGKCIETGYDDDIGATIVKNYEDRCEYQCTDATKAYNPVHDICE